MTLPQLQQKLQKAITQKGLPLTDGATGVQGLGALIRAVTGPGGLVIQGARISPQKSAVQVSGKVSLLNVQGAKATATFVIINSKPQVSLQVFLPSSWTFSQSYPNLPRHLSYSRSAPGLGPSALDQLKMVHPRFVLTTYAYTENPSYKRGLNFSALLDTEGPLGQMELLVGAGAPLVLSGLVDAGDGTPALSLRAPCPRVIDLGPVHVHDIAFTFESDRVATPQSPAPAVGIEGVVDVGSVTLSLRSEVCLGAEGDFIVMGGRFKNLSLKSLSDLTAWIGGNDLKGTLPSFVSPRKFEITEFAVNIAPSDRRINYVFLLLQVDGQWPVIPGALTLQNVHFKWLITDPFNQTGRKLSNTLIAQVPVGDVKAEVYASFPDFQFTGGWEEDGR